MFMDWQEISVSSEAEALEAVAEVFFRLGSQGVVIEDPAELKSKAESGLWDAVLLPEEALRQAMPVVKGYFPFNEELPGRLDELKTELAEIMARLAQESHPLVLKTINEEDWANAWKAFFKPIKIGERLVVRPTWEGYEAASGEIVLDLDPGMAFGTGGHITTVLCARFLEKYLRPRWQVLDVGTGTGILAMSAARLGAQDVLALDNDAVAVRVARENIVQNHLEDLVQVRQNDLLHGIDIKVDLVVANIIADVIIRLLPQANECLKPGGLILLSGIIGDRSADVADAARNLGFSLVEEAREQDWAAQVWVKGV